MEILPNDTLSNTILLSPVILGGNGLLPLVEPLFLFLSQLYHCLVACDQLAVRQA